MIRARAAGLPLPVPPATSVANLPFGVVTGTTGVTSTTPPMASSVSEMRSWTCEDSPHRGCSPVMHRRRPKLPHTERLTPCSPWDPARGSLFAGHCIRCLSRGAQHQQTVARFLTPLSEVDVLLPAESVTTPISMSVSTMPAISVALFRPNDPLLPNYKWVPIGYHGRALQCARQRHTSDPPAWATEVRRCAGTRAGPNPAEDFELELGCGSVRGIVLGEPVSLDHAESHVAGYCLLNDWSARDIQAW